MFSQAATLMFLAAVQANAGESFNLLKALAPETRINVPAPAARALPPRAEAAQQVVTYQRRGFQWHSDAQRAHQDAERNLRAAGFTIVSSQFLREPRAYGFKIDYADRYEPGRPSRQVFTYVGPSYAFESDARRELEKTVANLKASGYTVILGVTGRRGSSNRYHYEVDYIGRRPV